MEPKGSLPYSQVSATCPYPEQAPSSLHPLPLPEDKLRSNNVRYKACTSGIIISTIKMQSTVQQCWSVSQHNVILPVGSDYGQTNVVIEAV